MSGTENLYGAVIFLDRLGTKGIWKNSNSREVIKDYEEFEAEIEEIASEANKAGEDFKSRTGTKIVPKYEATAFSDTIIITFGVEASEKSSFTPDAFVSLAGTILPPLIPLGIAMRIYLRGAISVGSYFKGKKIMIGPAIDEAAQYHNLAEWIGVSAAPSANYVLSHPELIETTKHFFKCDISLKNGMEKNGWAINWPAEFTNEKNNDKKWKALQDKVEEEMRAQLKSTDVGIALKWRNTLDFYEKWMHQTSINK